MKITVNNIDISSRITSRKILSVIDENSPLLGNAVSKQLLLDVDNEDEFFNELLDHAFIITESNQNGVFNVFEKPEKYTKQLSLKLYDSMFIFSQRYDTQQSYPTTIENQLDEMSGLTNVEIDKSNIPYEILTKEVNWYDNTISMRNYLGWIAELCGMNAFSNSSGIIVFKPLAEKTYKTIDVEDYSKNEKVKITRVCFDDGLVKFEQGTTEGNTLYLSPNNSYIDHQNIIDAVFDKYKGIEFYSVNAVKMASIDGLEITELINYNDEFLFMPLSIDDVYKGGTYSILSISGNIDTKNKETVINRIDQSVRIRRIKTIVDQNNQSMQIIAQDVDENKSKITELEINTDKFGVKLEETNKKVDGIKVGAVNLIRNAKTMVFDDYGIREYIRKNKYYLLDENNSRLTDEDGNRFIY